MYESPQEWHEFFGDSRDDALAKAASFFGCETSALSVREAEPGKISGLGARVALVALPEGAVGAATEQRETRPERGEERRPERSEGRRRERPSRGRDRDRGDRDRGDRDRGRDRVREARPPRASVAPVDRQRGTGTANGELSEVGTFVCGLIERLGFGDFEISEQKDDDKVVLSVSGDATEELAKGNGRSAGAVQLLANQAAMRIGSGDAPRIVVDIEGQRSDREELLKRVADKAAKRAESTGRPVALEAMNSHDRRTVHVALREVEGIATMSVGEGRFRQVVVVPESAPEYEEAQGYDDNSR